eukprot:6486386-Amphidinium_carterae.1
MHRVEVRRASAIISTILLEFAVLKLAPTKSMPLDRWKDAKIRMKDAKPRLPQGSAILPLSGFLRDFPSCGWFAVIWLRGSSRVLEILESFALKDEHDGMRAEALADDGARRCSRVGVARRCTRRAGGGAARRCACGCTRGAGRVSGARRAAC